MFRQTHIIEPVFRHTDPRVQVIVIYIYISQYVLMVDGYYCLLYILLHPQMSDISILQYPII